MNYSDFLSPVRASIKEREDIEWSNCWWDNATISSGNRLLLVGDSTVRMVRSTLAHEINAPVDMLGTSSNLHDDLIIKLFDYFFSFPEYTPYKTIFVQLGHHGRIGRLGNEFDENDWELFRDNYRSLILYLRQYCSDIILESIFYSIIPRKNQQMAAKFKLRDRYDERINRHKERKNGIISEIAHELGCEYFDINEYMLTKGSSFRHLDHIHYEENAKKFIVKQMITYIKP